MREPIQTTINHRSLTRYLPLPDELRDDPTKNLLFDLSYLGVIDVIGLHGRDFLQGQLSCDVREVDAEHMRQGAMCNLKGRVLMLLDVLDWHGLHLVLPRDLHERTERLLSKPAALSHVTVQRAPHYAVFGFCLQNKSDILPFNWDLSTEIFGMMSHENGCCYSLGDGAYLLLIDAAHQEELIQPFMNKHQWRGSLAWHARRIQQGHIEIYPESSGLFLPHRLDLQQSGQLNFNKGCYKGQEIIARTHYRATLKHALKQFKIKSLEPLRSGLKLFADEGNVEIGELVDFCPISETEFIIAVSIIFEHKMQCCIEEHSDRITLTPC